MLQFATFIALLRFPQWVTALPVGGRDRVRGVVIDYTFALWRARAAVTRAPVDLGICAGARSPAAAAGAAAENSDLRRVSRRRDRRAWNGGGGRRSALVIPAGVYVRTSVDGAAGVTWRDGSTRASGRVDLISRFLLDPYREVPIGVSLGGGVSVPYASGDRNVRPYLTAVVDVEGRRRRGVTPAIQLGFGGGTRVGVVLRTSPSAWR